MIKGLTFWNDKSKYSVQMDNPTEQYNIEKNGKAGYTESCGPTSAINILAAGGKNIQVITPGKWEPQPEQVLWDYFNDPRNFEKFKAARPDLAPGTYPGNRIAQYYPVAIREVFGQECKFIMGFNFSAAVLAIQNGKGVQICLKKPGHFIPLVAFDDTTKELIYNDPYPDRFSDKNGFNRRMGEAEFKTNVQPYAIIYF
jgi:hypothetical protein